MNKIDYCLRDCAQFPCENFSSGPYPFAQGYLEMQHRRRQTKPPAQTPAGAAVTIPPEYWQDLEEMSSTDVCRRSLAKAHPDGGYRLDFLNMSLWVDVTEKTLKIKKDAWETLTDPLLELIVLLYLRNADSAPLTRELVSVNELKERHFFVGIHSLDVQGIIDRFGNDPDAFVQAAEALGGVKQNFADLSYKFWPFPKIPVTYLLWLGDEEFKPKANVCFDRSIERHFQADAIWGMVKRVSFELLSQR